MTKFSHYNFTFPANSSGFSPAINTQPVLAPKHQMASRKHIDTILKFASDGRSLPEMLHHIKAQAQLAASKKRPPATMHLHTIFTKSRSQIRSFAPPPSHLAHVRGTQPVRIRPHHAPPSTRPGITGASLTPKHDPTGNLLPALSEYLFRLSRLPPNGGTAFDPYLTPTWAGLKLPG